MCVAQFMPARLGVQRQTAPGHFHKVTVPAQPGIKIGPVDRFSHIAKKQLLQREYQPFIRFVTRLMPRFLCRQMRGQQVFDNFADGPFLLGCKVMHGERQINRQLNGNGTFIHTGTMA